MATKAAGIKLSPRDQELLICALLSAKDGIDSFKVGFPTIRFSRPFLLRIEPIAPEDSWANLNS